MLTGAVSLRGHVRLSVLGSAMAVALLSVATLARAAPIFFDVDSGALAATASFETKGTDLVVTLANTSTSDVIDPSQVLTAVFFDLTGVNGLDLMPVSAVVPQGSSVLFGGTDAGTSVGGEWAYKSGLSGAPGGGGYGISSAGLGLFGPHDLFPGSNLQGPESPSGIQYGITSAGDDPSTGNHALTGSNALIKNTVVFTLSGLPADFVSSNQITNVWFQYNTDPSDGGYVGIGRGAPEPATLTLLLCGAALCLRRRRRPGIRTSLAE
jgi:hypothetical protein